MLAFALVLGVYIYKVSVDQLWTASKCPPSVFGINKTPFELTYKTNVENIPRGARKIDLWMPYPQDTRSQTISDIRVKSPYHVQINTEPKFGNKILHLSVKNPKKDFEVSMKISAVRYEDFSARFIDENVRNLENSSGNFDLYLQKERVARTAVIKDLSKKALKTGVIGTALDKAKSIYEYMLDNYNADLKGKSLEAIYEALLKSQRIPATTVLGFSFKNLPEAKLNTFSAWTRFYIPGYGWVSADLASAKKFFKDKKYYFGNLDENRLELVTGRDLELVPRQKGKPINLFIYPYAEIDGKEFEVDKSISWKNEL
jgi:hypothetical protein